MALSAVRECNAHQHINRPSRTLERNIINNARGPRVDCVLTVTEIKISIDRRWH